MGENRALVRLWSLEHSLQIHTPWAALSPACHHFFTPWKCCRKSYALFLPWTKLTICVISVIHSGPSVHSLPSRPSELFHVHLFILYPLLQRLLAVLGIVQYPYQVLQHPSWFDSCLTLQTCATPSAITDLPATGHWVSCLQASLVSTCT